MEGQLFRELYGLLTILGQRQLGKQGQIFAPAVIVSVWFWAVLHERPVTWACQIDNWHGQCPWTRLPSAPTMSRRLRTIPVVQLQEQLLASVNDALPAGIIKRVDARPLPVGWVSKDKDARTGYGAGQLANGYKLHEITSHASGRLESWTLTAMNVHESKAAMDLIPQLQGHGYIGADNAYDVNKLYDLAWQQDHQLIASPKRKAVALGHRRHSPHRLHARRLMEYAISASGQWYSLGQSILQARKLQETTFAYEVTNRCGSLGPLPFFIRRPHRVARWVIAKLTINRLWRGKLLAQVPFT